MDVMAPSLTPFTQPSLSVVSQHPWHHLTPLHHEGSLLQGSNCQDYAVQAQGCWIAEDLSRCHSHFIWKCYFLRVPGQKEGHMEPEELGPCDSV